MLISIDLLLLWVLGTIGTIITFVACAFLGAWIASKVPLPKWLGALVGLFFHLPGCAVLLVIWGVVWLCKDPEVKAAARIDRAIALLRSYGYTVKEPPAEGGA